MNEPSYLGVRRKRLDASLWKLFWFHMFLFFFFFSLEKRKGERILVGKFQAHGLALGHGEERGWWYQLQKSPLRMLPPF